jgi:hypothetical protein
MNLQAHPDALAWSVAKQKRLKRTGISVIYDEERLLAPLHLGRLPRRTSQACFYLAEGLAPALQLGARIPLQPP